MEMSKFSDSPCNLCPRNCLAKRSYSADTDHTSGGVTLTPKTGYCLSGSDIKIARAALHMWEEPCISGTTGSGAIFFSGCNLRCIYCQNYEIAAAGKGQIVSVERLSEIMRELQEKGAANINLVTPDHYVLKIKEAIDLARQKGLTLPIVYNCSGYAKPEVIETLKGYVDIFLTDFKYMEEDLAGRFSSAPDYPSVAKEALKVMLDLTGEPVFDENEMMKSGVIVRHLLLPGHKKNAKAVIRYIYETYGDLVYLSLMNQYTPFDRLKERTDCKELQRKVTKREYEDVVGFALSLGIKNAFIQEGETAKESFVPEFDGSGL